MSYDSKPSSPPPSWTTPPETRRRVTLEDFLKNLFKLAHGYEVKNADGTVSKVLADRTLRNFIEHHSCTGTWNGSPVWRRLPSFYNRGKKYRLVGFS